MFKRLLPRSADNNFFGYKTALWLLGLLVFMRAGISVGSIFNARSAASTADGIPLDTFTPAGAQTVVALFAVLGLSQLIICLMGILVLVRYRALVPLVFAIFLLEHLSRKLILLEMPIARTGTPPGPIVSTAILALNVIGLALSVWPRGKPQAHG